LNLKEIGFEGMDRMHLAGFRVHWRTFVNMILNLWFP